MKIHVSWYGDPLDWYGMFRELDICLALAENNTGHLRDYYLEEAKKIAKIILKRFNWLDIEEFLSKYYGENDIDRIRTRNFLLEVER